MQQVAEPIITTQPRHGDEGLVHAISYDEVADGDTGEQVPGDRADVDVAAFGRPPEKALGIPPHPLVSPIGPADDVHDNRAQRDDDEYREHERTDDLAPPHAAPTGLPWRFGADGFKLRAHQSVRLADGEMEREPFEQGFRRRVAPRGRERNDLTVASNRHFRHDGQLFRSGGSQSDVDADGADRV